MSFEAFNSELGEAHRNIIHFDRYRYFLWEIIANWWFIAILFAKGPRDIKCLLAIAKMEWLVMAVELKKLKINRGKN